MKELFFKKNMVKMTRENKISLIEWIDDTMHLESSASNQNILIDALH